MLIKIYGLALLFTFFSTANCLAETKDLSLNLDKEETPTPIEVSAEEKLRMNTKLTDKIKKLASEGDEKSRRHLASAIKAMQKHQTLRANLKLPKDKQLKYPSKDFDYKNTDNFGNELNNFFNVELKELNAPMVQQAPKEEGEEEEKKEEQSVVSNEVTITNNSPTLDGSKPQPQKKNIHHKTVSNRKKFIR